MSRYEYMEKEEEWDEDEYYFVPPKKDNPKESDQRSPSLSSDLFGTQSYFEKINNGEVVFYRGHKGWHVERLQKALQKLGYDIGNDELEIFGIGTEKALKRFQKNAGFIGDEVDGVLGKDTLRILDLDYSLREPKLEEDGTHFVFRIPITEEMKGMTHDQYEIVVAKSIFKIPEGEAETLMRQYHIENWSPLTDEDIEREYKRITISKEIYYRYIAKIEEGGSDYSESLEELKERFFGMEEAYKLFKNDKNSPQLLKILKEKGFNSVEEFEEEIDRFLWLFQKKSVSTVFDILDKSKKQITIEEEHYADESGVADLKNSLNELNPINDQADQMMIDALIEYEIFQKVDLAVSKKERHREEIQRHIDNTEYYLPDAGTVTQKELVNGEIKNISTKDFIEIRKALLRYLKDNNVNRKWNGLSTYSPEGTKAYQKALAAENYLISHENDFVTNNVERFPIIADPKFRENLRTFTVNTSNNDLDIALHEILDDIKKNRTAMYNHFKNADNYEDVWELTPVILQAKENLNISTDSALDLIIKNKLEEVDSDKLWRSIGLAALGIGLAILSIATAGAASIGFLALGAAVSGVDFYLEYSEYQFQKQAYHSVFDRDKSLGTVNPSIKWVVLAAIGLGLDVVAVGKALKLFKATGKVSKDALELADLLAIELKQTGKMSNEASKVFVKNIEKIQKIKAIKALPEEDLLRIAKQIVTNPILTDNVIEMDNVLKNIAKLSDNEMVEVYKFYATNGNNAIENISKLVNIAEEGDFSNNGNLMKAVFTSRSVQNVILHNTYDPLLITRLWDDFVKPRTNPLQSKHFGDYLRYRKFRTTEKSKTLLTDFFKGDANKLGSKAKNTKVFTTTEVELSRQLLDDIKNPAKSEFSENLLKKVDDLLKEDLIGNLQTLEAARQKIISRLNKILGEEALDFTELRKILSKTQQSGTSGSIFEHWIRNKVKSLGKTSLRLSDDTLVKIDSFRIEKGFAIFTEVKWRPKGTKFSGHDLDQLENYAEILIDTPLFSYGSKQVPIKFEYIFDNRASALNNKELILKYFGDLIDRVSVSYITKTGKKLTV